MTAYLAVALALFLALVVLTAIWLVQLRTHNAGLVDVFWTLCVGGVTVLYAAAGDAPVAVRVLLGLFVGLWALRLAGHLALRMRGTPEDRRYAAIRQAWGRRADFYLLLFFWLQALVAWAVSLPLLVIAYGAGMPGIGWLVLAAVIWGIAVTGETVADYQLSRFKQNPANRGRVMDRGLWHYSRHPNYFFETLQWVAYVPLAAGSFYWWVVLVCPFLIGGLLLKVSGIPSIESKQASSRRSGYDEYVRRTSAFIPWPPSPGQ